MKRFNPFDIYGSSEDIKDDSLENLSHNSRLGDYLPESKFRPGNLKLSIDYRKTRLIYIFVATVMILIFGRTIWVQIVEGKEYREISEGNRIRIETVKARRGVIYDRSGSQLTRNIPNFTLSLIPADVLKNNDERSKILGTVSNIINIPIEEISDKLDNTQAYSYEPIEIAERIEYQKALLLNVKTKSFPGVKLETKDSREYLESESTSHLIGYTGKITAEELNLAENEDYLLTDIIGKTGLEYQYESTLKGIDGKQRIEVDSLGKEKSIIASKEPESGKNLTLSLELGLQKVLNDSLNSMARQTGSPGGSAVALDPRNGEVLAMVSSPGFDSNEFIRGMNSERFSELIEDPNRPLFARSISGQYPSGSTIKPVIASAALQDGIINSSTTILSTGGITVGPNFFPDWKSGGHGSTNVEKALAESVNTFFYTIGGGFEDFTGLGLDRINYYAKLFGLGEPLDIDLPGEAGGFLPTREWKEEVKGERWYLGDTYHLAIGQGDILVTPLQVANYTATIANGGTYYKPHLLKSFHNPITGVLTEQGPVIVDSGFIDSYHIKTIKEGLRQAVTSGSATALQSLNVEAAGKTGTAQFGDKEKTHAWFTGFAPYDSPEIVIAVLIEEGGGGHAAALPVARDGFSWYFSQK